MKGYYCVIQYCPDPGRFEVANVGVVLYCPETSFVRARTSNGNKRIIQVFGRKDQDWERINTLKKGIEERVKDVSSLDELKYFAATRANLLQMTPPMPIRVNAPEKDLDTLFERLVGVQQKRRTKGLLKRLAERILQPEIRSKIVQDVKVRIPVNGRQADIPFGWQNGRFNLVKPVEFQATNPDSIFTTACRYGIEGESLYQNPDPQLGQLQLVVVADFRSDDKESPRVVRRVFEQSQVRLFQFDEVSTLINEIKTTGKDFPITGIRHTDQS